MLILVLKRTLSIYLVTKSIVCLVTSVQVSQLVSTRIKLSLLPLFYDYYFLLRSSFRLIQLKQFLFQVQSDLLLIFVIVICLDLIMIFLIRSLGLNLLDYFKRYQIGTIKKTVLIYIYFSDQYDLIIL